MSDSNKKSTEIDYLEEDRPIPNQKFCCISFLSPEGIRNCTMRGLKVRGVYETYEEAAQRAEHLQKVDRNFHVFVGEVGKWLPWDPDPNSQSVKDQVYAEKELQALAKAHDEERKKVEVMERQRKQQMLEESKKQVKKTREEEARKRLQDKLAKKREDELEQVSKGVTETTVSGKRRRRRRKQTQQTTGEDTQGENLDLKKMKELVDNEAEKLRTSRKTLSEKETQASEINKNFDKIKKLYDKIKRK